MLKDCKIVKAEPYDAEEILNLYGTHLGGPAGWSREYPNKDTVNFDLQRNALFVMKNSQNEIIATITIDSDDVVENLECWSKTLVPSAELSRLCVREDMKNKGIARMMMEHTFSYLKDKGYKSVHILVRTGHIVALKSYSHLNNKKVGECHMFGNNYHCFEKEL